MAPIAPPTRSPVATVTVRPRLLIADVAALTGVAPSQLRSWDQAGLLRPLRLPGAVRLYTREDVARARLIKRSLLNSGRRGSVRRLMARLAGGELHPEPQDYAGLGEIDTPYGDGHPPVTGPALKGLPPPLLPT